MARIKIPAGTDWAYAFPFHDLNDENIDLTGWSARAQVRTSRWIREDPPLHTWVTTGPSVNAELVNSELILHVADTESSEWTWRFGISDIELINPDGMVARVYEGIEFEVSPEVTV